MDFLLHEEHDYIVYLCSESVISNFLMGIVLFCIWFNEKRFYMAALLLTKQAISQEMQCLFHLFMSELWGVQEGTHHRHQSSAVSLPCRLHVVLIDCCPLLLKCIINQYSNKSSFILEKCSFQLSGQEVLLLSMWSRQRGTGLHLALGHPWRAGANPSWFWAKGGVHPRQIASPLQNTYISYNINVNCKNNHEQQNFNWMVFRGSSGCFSASYWKGPNTEWVWYLFWVFSFTPTMTTLWHMSAITWKWSSGFYEAVFLQGSHLM